MSEMGPAPSGDGDDLRHRSFRIDQLLLRPFGGRRDSQTIRRCRGQLVAHQQTSRGPPSNTTSDEASDGCTILPTVNERSPLPLNFLRTLEKATAGMPYLKRPNLVSCTTIEIWSRKHGDDRELCYLRR